MRCPCLSSLPYAECCGPLHSGEALAATAERLMRSRFSAFAVADAAYLLATWHPSTRPVTLDLDEELRWYRLDILSRTRGGLADTAGTVEFVAWYRGTETGSLHEVSLFIRERDRWWYLDGVTS